MLRYHLGMTFEDIFIPISGQSESQLGNIYPREACVEITMKDLANVLHAEMSRMWSAGIIEYFPDSEIMYSPEDNAVIKPGMHLKLNDVILRRVDSDGERSDQYFSWKVAELVHLQPLGVDELCVGHKYEIFVQDQNRVAPFEVVSADMKSRSYSFKALKEGVVDLTATADNLPFVYPKGTCRHAEVSRIVVEYIDQGYEGEGTRQELLMHHVKDQNFKIELGQAHVVECIG